MGLLFEQVSDFMCECSFRLFDSVAGINLFKDVLEAL